MKIFEIFVSALRLKCDSHSCNNKVYRSMEDMNEGVWFGLCRRHYKSYRKNNYPMREII